VECAERQTEELTEYGQGPYCHAVRDFRYQHTVSCSQMIAATGGSATDSPGASTWPPGPRGTLATSQRKNELLSPFDPVAAATRFCKNKQNPG
jgi:hypothetical protein